MTTIALHDYLQEIEALIEEHRLNEAIEHCRHILRQYPRHVATYRTLSKVLIEKGEFADAADLLNRILSVEPNDFITHVALSIAHKGMSDVPRSIYHLQRALDSEPYNAALWEELQELHTLNKTVPPESMAPSAAALARLYLKSEMYGAAITELRQLLAQYPDRIDLKVQLAETVWWANQRVEAVSLALEVLDVLPNCLAANAILAEIWLQTGRKVEAQTYLKRLQELTLIDKQHLEMETAVGRAFNVRGAPPIPNSVMIEYYGEDGIQPQEDAVIEAVDSDWISEFSLEEDAEEMVEAAPSQAESDWFIDPEQAEDDESLDDLLGDVGDEAELDDWLSDAAAATGKKFTTQPLVMPTDPLDAESEWFVDPEQADEADSLADLLADASEAAQLSDWLSDLDSDDDLDEVPEIGASSATGFTGMLGKLADDEDFAPDDEAELESFSALFADAEDVEALDEAADESFAEGLTDLFEQADSVEETAVAPDVANEMDDFLAADLAALSDADEPDDDDDDGHTGYTQLFDELSTDAFPEEAAELDSDWLMPTTDPFSSPELDDAAAEDAPDWLADVQDEEFKPVQIDNRLASDWLTADEEDEEEEAAEADGDDWLAELAGDAPETPAAESQPPADDDLDIPTWMLGDEQSGQVFETPAPLDVVESEPYDTSDLPEDTAVPTWLLGGDQSMEEIEETDALDSSLLESSDEESSEQEEIPPVQASAELPDWLSDTPDAETEDEQPEPSASDPLSTDSMLSLVEDEIPDWLRDEEPNIDVEAAPTLDSSPELFDDDEKIPDWLLAEQDDQPETDTSELPATDPLLTDSMLSLVQDEVPDWLRDEDPEIDLTEIPALDSSPDLYDDDEKIPDWLLADLSAGQTPPEASVLDDNDKKEEIPPEPPEEIPEDSADDGEDDLDWLAQLAESPDAQPEDDSSSFASRIAAGEGGAVDEPPTQVSLPDDLADISAAEDDLDWLDSLSEPDVSPADEQATLDWSQVEPEIEDMLAGVTGELDADFAGLDSLAEEADEDDLTTVLDEMDSGTGWLDDLAAGGDTGPLDAFGAEPSLPDFEDSLAELPEEQAADLSWLEDLEVEDEPLPAVTDSAPTAEPEGDEVPEDLDDAMTWLEGLAAAQGARLEELPSLVEQDAAELDLELGADLADETDDLLDGDVDEVTAVPDLPTDEDADLLAEILAEESAEPVDETDFAEMLAPEVDDSLDWLEAMDEIPADDTAELELAEDDLPSADTALDWLDFADEADTVTDDEAAEEPTLAEEAPVAEMAEDMDDAMVWLEELAAKQDMSLEDMPGAEGDTPDETLLEAEVPEDMDDAMAWLEELAARQGAPLEELPSVSEVEAPEAEPESEVEEDLPATGDLDDAMGWLEDLAAEQESPLEDLPTIAGVVDEGFVTMPPSSEAEDGEAVEEEDELTAALDMLEQMALADGVELDRMVAKDTAVTGAEEDLAEALDWLERLAQSEDKATVADVPVDDLTDLADEMPEDPDEALAWLQQVAAAEEEDEEEEAADAVVEETAVVPDVTEEAPEPEPEDEIELEVEEETAVVEEIESDDMEAEILSEMPEDPDAAMAWLEQLAAKQGARLEELPSISADEYLADLGLDESDGDDTAVAPPEVTVDESEDLAQTLTGGEPPVDGSMDWLDDLADDVDQPAEDGEAETVEAESTVEEEAAPESEEGPLQADLTELEVPENMDDAMAWLEALAAQQGAALEELPTLFDAAAAPPAAPEPAEEEAESEDDASDEVVDAVEPDELVDETDEAAAEETAVADMLSDVMEDIGYDLDEEDEIEIDLTEGVAESLPDWLEEDTEEIDQMPGQTQWLRSLDEPDVSGWLEEEEATLSSLHDRTIRNRYQMPSETGFDTGPLPETGPLDLFEEEVSTSVFALDEEHLATARQAEADGAFNEAIEAYQTLVMAGGGMMTLIADLEAAAEDHPDQPAFRRLLGDAYMQNGQLHKALDTYRIALDQI